MSKQNRIKILLLEFYYSLFVLGTVIIYPILITFAIFIKLFKFIKNKQQIHNLQGQVAVITGSAGGLGRILAIELAKRGCHVAIVDIQQNLAEQTAKHIAEKYQVKTKAYKVDVSDYHQLEELNKNVTLDLGDVTILINNAGILTTSSLLEPTPQEIQNMINVNLTSVCFAQKVFLPKMKTLNRGHIINICSSSALFTSPFFDVYAGTKAAMRSITSALRIQLMSEFKNITATTVMPLFLNTNQQVESLVNKSGVSKVLPTIEGPIVAEYILESMLNNADEITIPNMFLYIYKLYEILPISVKEFMMRKMLTLELFYSLFLIFVIISFPIVIFCYSVYKFFKILRNYFAGKNIRGQVAVVTGGGGGLAAHISDELAKRGCHIALVDIQEQAALETAQRLAKTYNVKTKAYKVDIRDYDQLLQLRDAVTSDLGTPTILINNAAMMMGSSIKKLTPQEIKQMIEVNFTALCYTQEIFGAKMKELNQGHIVNISSIAALLPAPLLDVYAATKAAIIAMSRALRIELLLENKNVTVTTVMPSFLNTNKIIKNLVGDYLDFKSIFPFVDGDVMAKYVINGMLNGSREITGPNTILYAHKLLQLLPVFIQELLTTFALYSKFERALNSEIIDKTFKENAEEFQRLLFNEKLDLKCNNQNGIK
ncbi:uncharacterized protein ACRADG_011163 [Cochliomyia hominivorax]